MLPVRKTIPSRIRLMPPSLRPLFISAFAAALTACGGGNGGSDDTPERGEAPALTPEEIDLVVDFLRTLTDGYQP